MFRTVLKEELAKIFRLPVVEWNGESHRQSGGVLYIEYDRVLPKVNNEKSITFEVWLTVSFETLSLNNGFGWLTAQLANRDAKTHSPGTAIKEYQKEEFPVWRSIGVLSIAKQLHFTHTCSYNPTRETIKDINWRE